MKKILYLALVAVFSVIFLTGCTHNSKTSQLFPLLDNAKQVTNPVEGQLNYQTSSSIAEVAAFYRQAYPNLTERTLVTVESEEVLNLVFDGSENGQALVIQATPLNDSTVNVNVRYEAV